ncbi:MAG: DUF2341 domain-containing protein [bacterium]|nr:DUF2341 domain-containing protein [bacterium]
MLRTFKSVFLVTLTVILFMGWFSYATPKLSAEEGFASSQETSTTPEVDTLATSGVVLGEATPTSTPMSTSDPTPTPNPTPLPTPDPTPVVTPPVTPVPNPSPTATPEGKPNITKTEEDTDTGKLVTLSAPDETVNPNVQIPNPNKTLNSNDQNATTGASAYQNVVTGTEIPEIYKVGQENKIQIKWQNNNNQAMPFKAEDRNDNGKLDYIEWTVPHLSTQVFEIIYISKAFQLDENKEIISDIYDKVKSQDGSWASIKQNQTVRVTFQQVLDNTKDITLFARNYQLSIFNDQKPKIEVYPVYTDEDGNVKEGEKIATFENIDKENTYQILLTNLQTPTDEFDLKVVGGGVEFDYIVDPAGWYTGWSYRKQLTVSSTVVSTSDQTNFPLLIYFATDANIAANAQSTGNDIVITSSDGTTKLSHEIEKYTSATGELWVWVKIPTLSVSTNTTLYLYYGNTSAASQQDAANVWDANYKGVWHLKENAANTTVSESTSNANTGTAQQNTSALTTTGKADGALTFNGTSDYLSTLSGMSYTSMTYTGWFKFVSFPGAWPGLWQRGAQGGNNFQWLYIDSGTNTLQLQWSDGSVGSVIGTSSAQTWLDGGWHYIAVSVDSVAKTIRMYNNNNNILDGSFSQNNQTISGIPGYISSYQTNPGGNYSFTGTLDEVRISSTARSATWIATEYNNQSSPATYQTLGSQEAITGGNFVWTNGSGDNLWSTAGNWQGGAVPTASDIAVFNSSATGNATIDQNASVKGINIASGYTGTITQSASYTVTVGTNGFTQADGVFSAGAGAITDSGTFTLSSGTFAYAGSAVSVTGDITITGGSITRTSGTFNSGVVTADGTTLTIAKNGATSPTFTGAFTATYPGILLNGGIFNGTATFTKTGSSNDAGVGGNTFNSTSSFANSGSGYFSIAHSSANIYNGDIAFTNTGTSGIIVYLNSTGNVFNGNIIVNNTNGTGGAQSGVFLGRFNEQNYTGTGSLASTKTISVGGSGFSAGFLSVRGLTYSNTADLSLTLTGSAKFLVGGTTSFANNITVVAPDIQISGGTFNGTAAFTNNGDGELGYGAAGAGGAVFNSTASFTNSSNNKYLLLGSNAGDTFNGDVSFTNSGSNSIYIAYGAFTTTFAGNVTISGGTFLIGANGGTMQFTKATGIQTLDTGGKTIPKLVHSGVGTLQLTGNNLTVTTTLTNSAGTLDLNDKNLTATSATFSNDNGTIALQGGETITGLTQDATHGTFLYYGTSGPYTLKNYTYNNLTINGSGATFNLPAALTVNGNLTITAGTLDATASNYGLNVAGNWSNSGTFTARSGTVTFNKAGTQTVNAGGSPFYILSISSNSTVNTSGNNLSITTLDNNGTLEALGSETITITNVDINSGIILYDGGGSYTLSNLTPYYNLTFNNVSGSWTLPADTVVNNNLTITAGTLNLNGKNLTVTGTFSNLGNLQLTNAETLTLTVDTDSGTVTYTGTGIQTTWNYPSNNLFYNLTLNATGGTYKLPGLLTVNGNLTLTEGILDLNGFNLTVGGNIVRTNGTFANTTGRTLTLNGTTQNINTGEVAWDTVTVNSGVTAGSNLSITNLLSIAVTKTLSLASYIWSLVGNLLNLGTINEGTGRLDATATDFLITDSNFDEAGAISLDVDKLYITVSDKDGNLNGTVPDTITGAVAVTCGADEESLVLTETGNATMVFRYTGGLTVNLLSGSPTTENGILECADNATITAQYTDPQNNSDQLTDTTLATVDTVPVAPSGLTATVLSSSSIKWDWTDNSSNESGFKLYSSTGTLLATVSTGVTTYTETSLSENTTYNRKVVSYNNAGNSAYSSTVSALTKLNAPSLLSGTAISSTAITWSWTDNSSGETGFKLFDENNDLIKTITTANTTSYTETSLTRGQSYTRKVASYNNEGTSISSNSVTVATLALAPASPKLYAPAPDSELSTLTPSFTFGRVATVDGIKSYTLFIYTTAGTTKSYTIDNLSPGSTVDNSDYTASANQDTITITLKSEAGLVKGPHTWKVRATDNNNATGDSDFLSFTIVLLETVTTVPSPVVSVSPTPAPLEELAVKPLTPAEITKQYQAGKTPSRTSPALWLDNLEKQAELRAEKQALNLDAFLGRFFPIDKLIAFTNGIISFWEGLKSTLLAWFNFAKDQTIAFFMNANTTIRYRVITIAMTFMQDTENWWERMMWEGRSNRLALAEQSERFTNLAVNPAQRLANNLQASVFGMMEKIQGINVPKDAILADITANQTALKQSTNRLVEGTVDFFGRQFNATKQTTISLFAGAHTTFRYKVLAGTVTIAKNTGTWLHNLMSQGRENRLALAGGGTRVANFMVEPVQRVTERLRLASVGSLEALQGKYEQGLSIGDIHLSEITNNTAVLNWTTSHVTRAKVNYGESLMYGQEIFINDYRNQQTAKLTNLKPNTKYYFEIIVTDLQKEQTYDAYYGFVTKGE